MTLRSFSGAGGCPRLSRWLFADVVRQNGDADLGVV